MLIGFTYKKITLSTKIGRYTSSDFNNAVPRPIIYLLIRQDRRKALVCEFVGGNGRVAVVI